MGKKVLLLSVILLVSGWVMAQPEAEAISCINVSDVTLLPAAGCDLGGLTFSNFTVSASAGFIAGTKVGLGPLSTVSPTNVNLLYQLTTINNQTPSSAIGPGDVLLSYGVSASSGLRLTGINLTNDAITGPVTIGELACRVMFTSGGTCAVADRLAALVALPGEAKAAAFASPVEFAFLHKDIAVGPGGFISDFSNSHEIAPVPEPVTLLLFGSTMTGLGLAWRRQRKHGGNWAQS
ncbi:MAG TPA: PEP-CTERM sorting domain-containing protein [Methylomirabilota bacterium]|nr:PEP-CTERM sorting domain-containing protein [Methylomirabilota bacterium]